MSGSSGVRGSLLVLGRQTVRLDERIDVTAEVVGSATSWEAAKLQFAAECRTPDLPAEFLKNSP